ncbi:MAG: hypothetical protein COC22_00470 [Flavobacteriaceae bacterium]|nr:MAG: hypothetical protein COC22_00470 [Flavobacteriaceae bacterium]
MNILLVNMSVDAVLGGGTVERTRQLARELQKLPDTETKVLSTTANLKDKSVFGDSQFILLPCLNQRWYIPAPYFGKIYRSLRWADVVIIIGHWTIINAMVYWTNKIVKRPYLFCPAGALHIFGRSGIFKKVYNMIAGKAILKQADAVIAIPKDEREQFYKLGVTQDRAVVIPNGISPSDFEYTDEKGIRDKYHLGNAPFLLFMGRLNKIKGPDILLESFIKVASELPNWKLVFAGPDGGEEQTLKASLKKCRLEERVHFLGFISGDAKSELYHAASILVVPSRLEAMSIVALEAGICGTPTIMTDQCGFSELVDAGGAIEVAVDSQPLAESLHQLMLDEDKIKKMGQNAKKFIRMNYTWAIAAIRHRKLCEEVCNKSARRGADV